MISKNSENILPTLEPGFNVSATRLKIQEISRFFRRPYRMGPNSGTSDKIIRYGRCCNQPEHDNAPVLSIIAQTLGAVTLGKLFKREEILNTIKQLQN
jgi:hypothetical protein